MLTAVKNHLRLLGISFKYNLAKAMDNRISFLSQVFGMVLNNSMMIIQWIVLFSIKDNIGGYGFTDVLLLWAIAAGTYGVSHALFNNSFNLSKIIYMGKLDAFLVQPKNTLFYTVTSSFSVSAIGDIIFGYIVLIYLGANPILYLLYTLLILLGGIILASFSSIVHSLTFWFNNAEDFAVIVTNSMINFATYPNKIFSKEIQWIMITLIPVSFTSHIPVELLTNFDLSLFIILILVTIFISCLAFLIFKLGLKRYSSSNLVSSRI